MQIEEVSKELTRLQIRPSHQRIKVLEYLKNNLTHPTVDKIFNDLQEDIPTLSKSTIYNTLSTFAEAGLIKVLNIEDNETRYDSCTKDHGHFKCLICGEIFNFDLNVDLNNICQLKEFVVMDKQVFFKGKCSHCINM